MGFLFLIFCIFVISFVLIIFLISKSNEKQYSYYDDVANDFCDGNREDKKLEHELLMEDMMYNEGEEEDIDNYDNGPWL